MAKPSDPKLLPVSHFALGASLVLVLLMGWLGRALPDGEGLAAGHALLIRQVNLVDAEKGRLTGILDLLIEDGRITAWGQDLPLPASAQALDAKGLYAVAAPVDAAVFLSLEGRFAADSMPSTAEQSLRRQGQAGVAGVLDLNAHRSFMAQARSLKGVLPKAAFAGALFTAPGGWRLPGQTPWESHLIEAEEPADLDVPWSRALRFRDQALFASVEHEARDQPALSLAVLQRLSHLAKDRGIPFIVHCQHSSKAMLALQAAPDAILGPLLDLEPGLAAAMRLHGTVYLPALSVLLNGRTQDPKAMGMWFSTFSVAAALSPSALVQESDAPKAVSWAKYWARQGADPAQALAIPKRLHEAGVTLALGTGSGLPLVFHGLGFQTELRHWSSAGLPPAVVLKAATVHSRKLLREGQALVPGARADLLLLGQDPLIDPEALAHPLHIFIGGQELRP